MNVEYIILIFQRSDSLVNLLDIVPTILDWFNIQYPPYSIFKHRPEVALTGHSLLPLVQPKSLDSTPNITFASQSLHEITMYYPMRVARTHKYKLIQNLNYLMPFPIDQDFYISPTFQDMLNKTVHGVELPWYKSLRSYYYRPQWELYDIASDPQELHNLYYAQGYRQIAKDLAHRLSTWQNVTADPWICAPTGVLQDAGMYKNAPTCLPLYNGLELGSH